MLVIGDSFAARLQALGDDRRFSAVGWSGGTVGDDRFRRWAIAEAARLRPSRVILMAGGNDLAKRTFQPRAWLRDLEELLLGLQAAGVGRIWVMPIPPRSRLRQ